MHGHWLSFPVCLVYIIKLINLITCTYLALKAIDYRETNSKRGRAKGLWFLGVIVFAIFWFFVQSYIEIPYWLAGLL